MLYVLVLILGSGSSAAMTTQEFGSMEACQAAVTKYEAATKRFPQNSVAFCTRKT